MPVPVGLHTRSERLGLNKVTAAWDGQTGRDAVPFCRSILLLSRSHCCHRPDAGSELKAVAALLLRFVHVLDVPLHLQVQCCHLHSAEWHQRCPEVA